VPVQLHKVPLGQRQGVSQGDPGASAFPDAADSTPAYLQDITRRAIRAVWREIDGDNLDKTEQSALIRQMAELLLETPPSPTRFDAASVRKIREGYTDE